MQSYPGSFTGGTVQGASERRAGPPVRHPGRRVITRWLAVAAVLAMAPDAAAQAAPRPRPRLVVVIAVDQLRADYMERFRPYFGAGGFNLFFQRGASFAQGPADVADIAPTLSTLLGLLSPGGSQGRVLTEILR